MDRSSRHLTRGLLIVVAACLLTVLPSCEPPAKTDAEASPNAEREDLARRLGLSPDRFAAIRTGDQAPDISALDFNPDNDCSGGWCTCTGDEDCNEMFSGICSSPSTGGICQIRGDVPRCRCKDPRAG